MTKHDVEPKMEEMELPQVVNISGSQVDTVEAELVRVDQSPVGNIINAEEVDLNQSGAMHIAAADINTQNSFIGAAQAENLTLNNSGALALQTNHAEVNGRAGVIIAQNDATLNAGSKTGLVAASNVKAESVRTAVLLTGKVEGHVETIMDTQRVLLASMVAGIAAGTIMLLGQFLFNRKNSKSG